MSGFDRSEKKRSRRARHKAHAEHAALYWRVALLSSLVVLTAAVLSFILSRIIPPLIFPGLDRVSVMLFGIAFKEMLMPIITVLLAVGFFCFTSRSLTSPISKISHATREIAAGDFSTRIDETGRTDELGVLQRNFNLMAAELEGNELLKRDFTANISHQFKTPLAVIQGYSHLLEEDGISDEERKKYAALISRESDRLAKLSSDMLRLSKLENQEIIVSPTRFLLNEQILQTIVRLEPKWTRRGISFNIDLPEVFFVGDEELLAQVWLNIIDNAVKFTRENTEITVDMLTDDSAVTISVTDMGAGMDAMTKDHIFQRYYQGKNSGNEGSGLGLSIVKRIVDLHHGSVTAESVQGKGTTITVVLPILSYDI